MKTEWNSTQYLKFKNQRTQPAMDLVSRLAGMNPKTVIDLGCGPGNSTVLLAEAFPKANIIGIDSSEDMIKKAKSSYPDIQFEKKDVYEILKNYDLIFTNACLQWIPNHEKLIPFLMNHLTEGGTFASQFPMNEAEPLYRIIKEVTSNPKWMFDYEKLDYNGQLTIEEYYNILYACSSEFQIWETKYCHDLESHRALIEWVKGTKIRPFLAQLNDDNKILFETELENNAKCAYPTMQNGHVLFGFNRFFIIAKKS